MRSSDFIEGLRRAAETMERENVQSLSGFAAHLANGIHAVTQEKAMRELENIKSQMDAQVLHEIFCARQREGAA